MTPAVSRYPETKPAAETRNPAARNADGACENRNGTLLGSQSIRTDCVRAMRVYAAWRHAWFTGNEEEAAELLALWRQLAGTKP